MHRKTHTHAAHTHEKHTYFLPHLPLIIQLTHFAIIEPMFSHETRPHHFLMAALLVVIGGVFVRFETWEYIGWALWIVAASLIYFLLASAARDHELRKIEREHERIVEIMKLDVAKLQTRVVIDKTDLVGNALSLSRREVPLDPIRLKLLANGVLKGRKFTIREWTPIKEGKLMSDNEWRDLIEFLKQPDPYHKDIKFIVPRNPGVINSAYDWTPAGEKWLKSLVEDQILTPVSA